MNADANFPDKWEVRLKSTGFRLLLGLLVSGLFVGCGSGGSKPPANPLSVTTTSLSQGQAAVAYSATLSATGGTAPYSWSVKSGALPAGLSLSTAGAISGTPTAAGASTFVAQVTDSKSASASSGNLSIAISGGMLQITTTSAPTGTVGTAYQLPARSNRRSASLYLGRRIGLQPSGRTLAEHRRRRLRYAYQGGHLQPEHCRHRRNREQHPLGAGQLHHQSQWHSAARWELRLPVQRHAPGRQPCRHQRRLCSRPRACPRSASST